MTVEALGAVTVNSCSSQKPPALDCPDALLTSRLRDTVLTPAGTRRSNVPSRELVYDTPLWSMLVEVTTEPD